MIYYNFYLNYFVFLFPLKRSLITDCLGPKKLSTLMMMKLMKVVGMSHGPSKYCLQHSLAIFLSLVLSELRELLLEQCEVVFNWVQLRTKCHVVDEKYIAVHKVLDRQRSHSRLLKLVSLLGALPSWASHLFYSCILSNLICLSRTLKPQYCARWRCQRSLWQPWWRRKGLLVVRCCNTACCRPTLQDVEVKKHFVGVH